MKRLLVGCTKFPNMMAGQIGFATSSKENCMEPHYPYQNGGANGFIHIRNHEELALLTQQIDVMTKEEFCKKHNLGPKDAWRNRYIRYLDKEIHKALLETGILLTIDNIVVKFYTEPGYYQRTTI